MTLRPASAADFPFIRALAGRPENTPFITDEDEAGLALYLTRPDERLLIWERSGQPAGFAVFAEIGHPTGRVELRRLALSDAGAGAGLGFVQALTQYGFSELGAKRIWLDASGENPRAHKVYIRAGYQLEGCQRAHWWRPGLGRAVDLMLFGLMRDDWQG